jgi:hypothetical protein
MILASSTPLGPQAAWDLACGDAGRVAETTQEEAWETDGDDD